MINKKFEAYKISRELKRSGASFVFYRKGLNRFKEKSEEKKEIVTLRGLYHEIKSYIKVESQEGFRARTEKSPMILCLYDSDSLKLQIDDILILSGIEYKVTGLSNISNWNILVDISLEVVDDGTNKI